MKKEKLALGGAIGASLLIGACCLGPALFVVFGVSIGALVIFASFEPYRPHFVFLGGGALGFAAFHVWFSPMASAPDAASVGDRCTPNARDRRRMRRAVTMALILYVVAIALPYVIAELD